MNQIFCLTGAAANEIFRALALLRQGVPAVGFRSRSRVLHPRSCSLQVASDGLLGLDLRLDRYECFMAEFYLESVSMTVLCLNCCRSEHPARRQSRCHFSSSLGQSLAWIIAELDRGQRDQLDTPACCSAPHSHERRPP